MRRFCANYVYPVQGAPIKNGIVEVDEQGIITNIIKPEGDFKESRGIEFHSGIIVPGFVNAHCHLELSHMKGALKEHTGLPEFIRQVPRVRGNSQEVIDRAIEKWDRYMRSRGIVAVGDISNTTDSFQVKKSSDILYHSFVEVFGSDPKLASDSFNEGKRVLSLAKELQLSASLSPHAPYSISKELFLKLKEHFENNKKLISIHNQETDSENEMFYKGTGEMRDLMASFAEESVTDKNIGAAPYKYYLNFVQSFTNLLLVHNSKSTKEDIDYLKSKIDNLFMVLCPRSNVYIENKAPDCNLFYEKGVNVALGTDSLASNHDLSVLEEMKYIQKNFSDIPFETVLQWACLNGAKALNFEDRIGSLDIGKKPGLNLITGFDFKEERLTEKSQVKVLV